MLPPYPPSEFEALAEIRLLASGQAYYRSKSNGVTIEKFVTAGDLHAAFAGVELDTGWLPPGVVRYGENAAGPWYVYSAPAQKLDLILDGKEPAVKNVPIPRTVLVAYDREYYLWSTKTMHFAASDPVWQAPFPNLHASSGRICWGTNAPPKIDATSARKAWDLFFETAFNNHLADGKSQAHKGDVRSMLREIAGQAKYPLDDLQPLGYRGSVESAVKNILEGRGHAD